MDRNVCSRCDEIFQTTQELLIHSSGHIRIDTRIKCFKCSSHFTRPEDYFDHSCPRRESNTKPRVIHRCGICPEQFRTMKTLIRHQFTHPEYKYTLCARCGQVFPSRKERSVHIRTRHKQKELQYLAGTTVCELYGKTLKNPSLKSHMELCHSESPPVMCEECGKLCKNQQQLQFHKLTHLPEPPQSCDFCSVRLVIAMIQHLAWQRLGPDGFIEIDLQPGDEKPFKCSDCDNEYTTQMALDEHRLFHGERTFKCRQCGWKCFTNYHLKAHNAGFHSSKYLKMMGPMPSSCRFCGKSAGNRWELYVHEIKCPNRIIEQPIRIEPQDLDPSFMKKTDQGWHCEQCNKTYKEKKDIKYHYRAVHSGTYLYVCEICGRGTNNTVNMKAHMMRKHRGAFEGRQCGERLGKCSEFEEHEAGVHLPISTGNLELNGTLKGSRKTDSKLLQALAGLDGEQVYKLALIPKNKVLIHVKRVGRVI